MRKFAKYPRYNMRPKVAHRGMRDLEKNRPLDGARAACNRRRSTRLLLAVKLEKCGLTILAAELIHQIQVLR